MIDDDDFRSTVRRALASRPAIKAGKSTLFPASVLLPFFASEDGATKLWLVRRPLAMRIHGGQVALPGGKRELHDADLLSTALREAHEEIGLMPGDVEVLGELDDCVTITGFAVTPFVGWIAKPFRPQPLATEVARVFAAPFVAFEQPPRDVSVIWGESKRIVLSYETEGEIVWGATASILHGFVERVQGARGQH